MRTYETKIKACTEEFIYYDKKLRQRSYKFDKYIIVLEENAPFVKGDDIKIINADDFNKLGNIVRQLQEDKNDLKKQVEDLQTIIQYHNKAENDSSFMDKIKSFWRAMA
ncbi:hypothetical protein [Methanobacterium alcaliphilum]|uniref:hypothetical protein n=1 Tax=Methanobacterium alcaliphilum TaxID=392018 RepID=UPI00200A672D|nr:hypothetical protein [Methanobacterium alcaliphilum]MCK9150500.1 hypothetical protein [Methanobacterium alcaliphilum]